MKVLIVSYYFPPFNTVGAVRVGKTAKYLLQAGHEVNVITADDQPLLKNLPVEIPETNIIRTRWFDVNRPIQFLLGGKKNVAVKGYENARQLPKLIKMAGYFYRNWINFPDGQIGWYPYAMKAANQLLSSWRPDVIFASCPPLTTFNIAKKLARMHQIPWVADLRDLWADNYYAYKYYSPLRRLVNTKVEKNALSTASCLITVSQPLADILQKKYPQHKVHSIANGYDCEDYPSVNRHPSDRLLNITFTGTFYPEDLDSTPLWQALALMGTEAKKIMVNFYGKNNHSIKHLANHYGVGNQVNCYDMVPYHESLQHQVNADILLLVTDTKRNSQEEKGLVSAKLFEYLGARRPILLLGCIDGVAAQIIHQNQAGLAENDPHKIIEFLRNCISNKERQIPNELPIEAIQGYSRQERTGELIACLEQVRHLSPF